MRDRDRLVLERDTAVEAACGAQRMVDHAGQRDALERALLELDAMACIFCNDFADEGESFEEFIITTQDALERARAYVDSPVDEILDIPQIDAEVLIHTAW